MGRPLRIAPGHPMRAVMFEIAVAGSPHSRSGAGMVGQAVLPMIPETI